MAKQNVVIKPWHYIAAVVIPSLLIVASLLIILVRINDETTFAKQEIDGVKQVDFLHEVVLTLQKIRGLNLMASRGEGSSAKPELHRAEQTLDQWFGRFSQQFPQDQFAIGPMLASLHKEGLKLGMEDNLPDSSLFDAYTALVDQAQDIRYRVATRSNLILDPELETYFLMDLVVTGLPNLVESVGKVRGLGSGLLASKTVPEVDRFRFGEKLGGMRQSLENVQRSRRIILEASPGMEELFNCFTSGLDPSVGRFSLLGEALLNQSVYGVDAEMYFQQGTMAIDSASVCYQQLGKQLLLLLEARVSKLEKERFLLVGGLLMALALMIFAVTEFYLKSRRAFHDLKNSEERSRAVFESAVDGIITIDAHGIIRSANHSCENIFGYTPGELVGSNVSLLIPPPHREAHDGYLKNYLTTGERKIIGYIREITAVCKDGGQFPAEISVSEFKVDGETFFTGILHDITERKKSKQALDQAYQELEQRVLDRTRELQQVNRQMLHEIEERKSAESGLRLAAKVFENASEAILITDINGDIIEVNQAFTNITRFERDEVIGKNPRIAKSGRHDDAFYKEMWDTILGQGQWSGEIWDRRKNGEVYPKWLSINAVKDDDGKLTHFVAIFSDISQIKATEQRLEQLAFYDPLTKLPNRMLFRDRLIHEFDSANRDRKRVAVFFIDLDRFKHVNDTFGHAAGDLLLVEVAKRISLCIRNSDTVSRLGGDEFTVILADLRSGQDASPMAQKMIDSLQKPFDLNGHQAHIGASIGISVYPDDGEDFDTITKHADMAMYNAKSSGRGVYKYFKPEMNASLLKRVTLENEMRLGLDTGQFILHYQPKVEIRSGRILGMESLVRWLKPDGAMVSPGEFIPLAEETGLIVPMGEQILKTACRQNKEWMDTGLDRLKVAVNLSARQFQNKDLQKTIEAILEETGLPPERLELEVTESMMMNDQDQAVQTLKRLRDIGLSIAMDDFGTGYSSLGYLKRFPINALKIDQSFVRDLTQNSNDAAIVSAIVSMSKSLKLYVVAEGVETREQLDFLRNIGCDECQGYYISRPVPAEAFARFIKEDRLPEVMKS